jgi:hypothetical protein
MRNNTKRHAKGGEISDELIEYTIPSWALPCLINGDYSGLANDEIEKLNKFVDKVAERHGNAFFMLGDLSEESNFSPYNDIDNLGSDVVTLYIRPSEKFAKGGQTASIGDSGIITDKNSMFVGKLALITGDLGNMYEVRVGGRTTIVKKNGIKIIPDEETYYADGEEIYKLAEEMSDAYEVELEAVPNSDYDQYSHRASSRVKKTKKSVKSIEEAVKIAKNFIDENDLGGGNFLPAKIYKNGKHIGFISYNGRVWNNDQSEMKYAQGGEMESEDMEVQFIEYNGNEIMYEPHYKKYYANDVEFDSLKDAQIFLDSGKISSNIRGAYQKGLFAKGGEIAQGNYEMMLSQAKEVQHHTTELQTILKKEKDIDAWVVAKMENVSSTLSDITHYLDGKTEYAKGGKFKMGGDVKKPTWIAIYQKGKDRNILEVNASSIQEAKLEAENDKKRYNLPQEMFLYDIYRKYAKGGEVSSQKIYEVKYEIGGKKHTSQFLMYDSDRVENLLPPATKIISIIEKHAQGGEIGFIPMELEEKLILLAKWGGTNERGVIGLLNAMIDSGITDEDLKYTLLKKETRLRREKAIEMKIDEIWRRIQPKYNQELKGNMYYSTLKELITRSGGTYENLLQKFKPFRKYQKFSKGGEVELNKLKKQAEKFNKNDVRYKEIQKKIYELEFEKEYALEGSQAFKKFHARGGKIGFQGLANKVAKRYVGKKVSKEYQAEYGKTYDAKEAKEVGNKVAGKVYQQQVAKKKIVRKLQRKTN